MVSMPVRAFLDSDRSPELVEKGRAMGVSMPVRAFLDSDEIWGYSVRTLTNYVSMPVRAFLDSDCRLILSAKRNAWSFNARQGIS